jgi:hypothetical protein
VAATSASFGPSIIQLDQPTHKNVWVAALLALLFGPPGMAYSTQVGALVMGIVTVLVLFLGNWLLVTAAWAVCVFWAAMAARD